MGNSKSDTSILENGHLIFNAVDSPILILDTEGQIVRSNTACHTMSGYSGDEMVGYKMWEFLTDQEETKQLKSLFAKDSLENFPTNLHTYCKSKSGDHHHVIWSNALIHDDQGMPTHLLATGVNITKKDATELELAESQAFLRSIMDASPVAVVTINERGKILTFSREAEKTFGYCEADVRGKNVKLLMPEPDQSRHDGYMNHYLATGERRIIGQARPITALRKSGIQFPAVLHVSEFQDGERIFVGFVEDVSEQKETEQNLEKTQLQLQHAGRIGAMGEIATSIAHELNQPLTAAASLAGAASLILKKTGFEQKDEILNLLDDSVDEIQRASQIIRQMRDFVRKRQTAKSLHDVNHIVEEAKTIALLGSEMDGIHVKTNLSDDTREAHLDRIKIQQVIVNLVRNAVEAMRDAPEKILTIATLRTEYFIEIQVEDTGTGIPTDVRKHLFDPFITSKDDGMGVGLSISKSIIDAHQGEIFVNDKDGSGSVFIIKLPIGNYDESAR